jgi:Fur family ferric uptake transcriptional regulator
VRAKHTGTLSIVRPHAEVDAIISQLRARGRRITSTRRALAAALIDHQQHPTADDLIASVQVTCPDAAPSTIYRILTEMEQAGIVVHVHLGHTSAVYHLAEEGHGHLACDRCGTIIELPGEIVDTMAELIQRHLHFTPAFRHFSVTGVCGDCDR